MIPDPGDRDLLKDMWALDLPGVKEWLLCPGMLFQAKVKWWGDRGPRGRLHEGLDLLLYRDREDRVLRLTEETGVLAICDGVVVGMIPDFLGKSIIVEHALPSGKTGRLYAIYGHTRPTRGIGPGKAVNRGDGIAVIASPGLTPFPMAPHLHLSIAWSAQPIPCDRFSWNTIGISDTLSLLDPLRVVAIPHRIVGRDDPACRDL